MTASGTVLILTPLKDATAHVDGYLANLRRLTYPNKRISLGLLESDSADETYLAFEQRVPDLRTKFRSVGLWKRDFGYRLPTHVHRWAPTVQVMRRAVLARSRNHLLFRALDDQDWVRPEEISLFRSVYGKQFILVSAFAPLYVRRKRIEELERRSRGGLISDVEVQTLAHALVTQDAEESLEKSGQKLRDAFPLGDVFIDATTKPTCEAMIRRFIQLFSGNNRISPTRDEYGMYLAKSASLRSLDLSRQVGAAAFNKHGEVVSLGCNEVPRAGGGTYWSGEGLDHRDVIEGHDPNETKKIEVLADIIDH